MRVDLIAPVRLSARPRLELLVQRDLADVCSEVATRTGLDPGLLPGGRQAVPGVIFEHEPTDDVLLPRYLCRGAVQIVGVDPAVLAAVRAAEIAVTPYGLAIVGVAVDVADATELASVERALCTWVGELAADFVGRFRTALTEQQLLLPVDAGTRGLPQDSFLWWHRALERFTPPVLESETSLDRFPDLELRPGTRLRVGDGYSLIETDSEHERGQLLEGLHAATQIWLVTDRLQRQLAEQASRLRAAAELTDSELRAEQDQALRVCEETMLESQLLLEEQRYMAGARRQALEAASESWRMPLDLRGLFEAADSVRDVVDRRVQQRREAQADRLNRLLAALTMVTALSVVLLIFATAVGPEPETWTANLIVAATVAVATVVSVVVVLRRRS